VRLPMCAVEALGRIMARRGVSRDEALRQIVEEHVAQQEACEPDERRTHISTMLRYPAPPPKRTPRTDQAVRLRLDPGVLDRARAVSLRLPGQSHRAHRDYQARPLTDAVMTAIAVREPFADEFLDGLLPLLRHKAAFGFWRLVVEVSSTAAELAVVEQAELIRRRMRLRGELTSLEHRLLLVEEALGELSWHAPERFVIAANLARVGLSGEIAEWEEGVLFEQGKEWDRQRAGLRQSPNKARWFVGVHGTDWSGRGGTVVWRAERRVERGDFVDWLTAQSEEEGVRRRVASPPGWQVRMPAGWQACVLSADSRLPTRFRRWIEAGQALLIDVPERNKQVVWPLQPGFASPVPGVEPLVAIARGLRPEQVIDFVEAILVEWGTSGDTDEDHGPEGPSLLSGQPNYDELDVLAYVDDEEFWTYFDMMEPDPEESVPGQPPVDVEFEAFPHHEDTSARWSAPGLLLPVDEAFKFGYITAEERRITMADARALTVDLPNGLHLNDPKVPSAVSADDPRFRLLLTRRRTKQTAKPMWVWPGRSVAAEIGVNTSPDVIGWLATWAYWTARRYLQGSMELVWHAAFDRHPASYWHHVRLLGQPPNDGV
jgi:hypothetical protein